MRNNRKPVGDGRLNSSARITLSHCVVRPVVKTTDRRHRVDVSNISRTWGSGAGINIADSIHIGTAVIKGSASVVVLRVKPEVRINRVVAMVLFMG